MSLTTCHACPLQAAISQAQKMVVNKVRKKNNLENILVNEEVRASISF
jgi:hypothetical protein